MTEKQSSFPTNYASCTHNQIAKSNTEMTGIHAVKVAWWNNIQNIMIQNANF